MGGSKGFAYTDLEFETRNRVRAEQALERTEQALERTRLDLERYRERDAKRRRDVVIGTLSSALSWSMLLFAFVGLVWMTMQH